MKIVHTMKDGTVLDDIAGRVVKIADAEPLYRYIESINRTTNK